MITKKAEFIKSNKFHYFGGHIGGHFENSGSFKIDDFLQLNKSVDFRPQELRKKVWHFW